MIFFHSFLYLFILSSVVEFDAIDIFFYRIRFAEIYWYDNNNNNNNNNDNNNKNLQTVNGRIGNR